MQKLPIGIQTFKKIREGGYIYVDKTKEALDLIQNYEYAFLFRPRRFGKSLFLDTLKNIFEGKKELFRGLYIYDKYSFEEYPVIKIDWAGDFKTLNSTKKVANFILENNQKRLEVDCKMDDEPFLCFQRLIYESYKKYNKKVVVLIDEYDKPILDNIEDTKRAMENRDFLKGLYIQLKANDEYIHFAFLTGISKFSKASIFSGLNNLEDISLTPSFGNICGYTNENIKEEFYEYSKDFDLQRVQEWYNGYYFLKDRIYNPFDILKLFKEKRFKNYWWESGNPYFLIQMLKKHHYYIPKLENLIVGEDLLNSFEIENLKLEVLLYQAGYLTIKEFKEFEEYEITEFVLGVPNKEVQISLNTLFYEYFTSKDIFPDEKIKILQALKEENLEIVKESLFSLFASIPYNNYVKNQIGKYEGYYASVLYAYLASLGLKLIAEDVTNEGRVDLSLFVDDVIYLIEFKVGRDDALHQLKEKRYYEKYLAKNKKIYLVGINFDPDTKNIEKFSWQRLDVSTTNEKGSV